MRAVDAQSQAPGRHSVGQIPVLGQNRIEAAHLALPRQAVPKLGGRGLTLPLDQVERKTGGQLGPEYFFFSPEHHPAKAYKLDDRGLLTGYHSPEAPFLPRQSLPKALYPNGAIYIFLVGAFLENNCIPRYGNKPYVMSREESIDIDSPADITIAEAAIEKRSNDG